MRSESKILILNPNPENLENIIDKANAQNSKIGPFELVILLGDVLSVDSEIPKKSFNTKAVFTKGIRPLNQVLTGEDDENDILEVDGTLGLCKKPLVLLRLSSGITVVFISGSDLENINQMKKSMVHEMDKGHKIDIVVSFQWPNAIAQQEKQFLVGDPTIDELIKIAKPRYHFAVGKEQGKFLEFPPFKWSSADGNTDVTRFVSLGLEGTGDKWYYAIDLSKHVDDSDGLRFVPNPFENTNSQRKRPVSDQEEDGSNKKQSKLVLPSDCFFCLSNPTLEVHMIVAIGKYSYVTVAKGPLTKVNPFSGHLIIIPISHISTIHPGDTNVLDTPLYKEILEFENSIMKAYEKNLSSKVLVSFDISRKSNVHYHKQLLAIPRNKISSFENSLNTCLRDNEKFEKNMRLTFEKLDENDEEYINTIGEQDYIRFTVHESTLNRQNYICKIDTDSKSLDLQFPRRVLARLLNCPKRVYWNKCKTSKFLEIQDCEEFKKFYDDFDFTK